jgi:hypothetical protein
MQPASDRRLQLLVAAIALAGVWVAVHPQLLRDRQRRAGKHRPSTLSGSRGGPDRRHGP